MGYVFACRFQRESSGPWEYGFYINENVILDSNGNQLDEVWDIDSVPSLGCFHLPKGV